VLLAYNSVLIVRKGVPKLECKQEALQGWSTVQLRAVVRHEHGPCATILAPGTISQDVVAIVAVVALLALMMIMPSAVTYSIDIIVDADQATVLGSGDEELVFLAITSSSDLGHVE
jgi:hypothetical protein